VSIPSNCEEWVESISFEERRRKYTSSLNLCPYYAVSAEYLVYLQLVKEHKKQGNKGTTKSCKTGDTCRYTSEYLTIGITCLLVYLLVYIPPEIFSHFPVLFQFLLISSISNHLSTTQCTILNSCNSLIVFIICEY